MGIPRFCESLPPCRAPRSRRRSARCPSCHQRRGTARGDPRRADSSRCSAGRPPDRLDATGAVDEPDMHRRRPVRSRPGFDVRDQIACRRPHRSRCRTGRRKRRHHTRRRAHHGQTRCRVSRHGVDDPLSIGGPADRVENQGVDKEARRAPFSADRPDPPARLLCRRRRRFACRRANTSASRQSRLRT
jgi:hypothetical protein